MICPHCMVTVRFDFEWGETYPFPNYSETKIVYQINSALCPNCNDLVVIVVHGQGGLGQGEYFLDVDEDFQEQVVFPIASTAPMPTADMPEEIQNDYLEARAVLMPLPAPPPHFCDYAFRN